MAVPKENLPVYTFTLDEAINSDFKNYGNTDERGDYSRENKPFIYPGPFARNISETKDNQRITRGFMRSIIMDSSISAHFGANTKGNLRLNFQFNPEYIERRVDQSVGAVNPLLQNPANLTQAVPGSATFNFTMMFNREEEVARTPLEKFVIDADNPESALKNPGIVGVMHDLSIFDSIIGQGITPELVSVITAYTKQQNVAEINAQLKNPKKDENGKDLPNRTYTPEQNAELTTALNANFGNSAFLNPMPVRIVFSDLFMVEGLITSSAVAFQKFSQNMVPTICQVNCTVMALYVGFAKQKAYLTDNLTSWAKTEAEGVATATAEAKAGVTALKQSLNKLALGVNVAIGESKLSVPTFNSIGLKEFRPGTGTTAGKYLESADYYGGNGGNAATRWVTLPQWFNAFAASDISLGIMRNTADTQFVGKQVTDSFGYNLLPITIYLETTDKDFNNVTSSFTAQINDVTTGQIKNTNTTPSSSGSAWVPIKHGEFGYTNEYTKNSVKYYVFRNTFYVDPVNVTSVKQTIKRSSTCELKIGITFNKPLPNENMATLTTGYSFSYRVDDKFFYAQDLGNAGSNYLLLKKYTLTLKSQNGERIS